MTDFHPEPAVSLHQKHIARRQHAEVMAQHARAAAVVRNGHDGGDVLCIALEAAQHGGKPVSPADGGNARLALFRLIEPYILLLHRHPRVPLLSMSRCLETTV